MFIKLTDERQFEEFYRQAGQLLKSIVNQRCGAALDRMLDDALRLNRALVKQPFVRDDAVVETSSDLMSFYTLIRQGEKPALRTEKTTRADRPHEPELGRFRDLVPRGGVVGQQEGRLSLP